MPWRCWAHECRLFSPALTVLAGHWNNLPHHIDLMDDIFPAATMSSSVLGWLIDIIDDSGQVLIVTEPAYIVLSYGTEDAHLAAPLVELLIGHTIRSVHLLNGPWRHGTQSHVLPYDVSSQQDPHPLQSSN